MGNFTKSKTFFSNLCFVLFSVLVDFQKSTTSVGLIKDLAWHRQNKIFKQYARGLSCNWYKSLILSSKQRCKCFLKEKPENVYPELSMLLFFINFPSTFVNEGLQLDCLIIVHLFFSRLFHPRSVLYDWEQSQSCVQDNVIQCGCWH